MFDKIRGNPRFVPEFGFYEGWMTPLKWNWRTHALKIECDDKLVIITYEPGDYLLLKEFTTVNGKVIQHEFIAKDLNYVERLLRNCRVEFVRKDKIDEVVTKLLYV